MGGDAKMLAKERLTFNNPATPRRGYAGLVGVVERFIKQAIESGVCGREAGGLTFNNPATPRRGYAGRDWLKSGDCCAQSVCKAQKRHFVCQLFVDRQPWYYHMV
ncbi:hypothetical protein Tcan_08464 [Toxocara canis]|uniref:Uncharacterized protein n=1 Tax=Toxocara canis TaxID=6265 RepID=A0A0B2VW25_TOXCA|nr:hypothetical protein Tcan_08464 [Toxocara canis]